MPIEPVRNLAVIVNDESTDTRGQLGPGETAVDGDGNALVTTVVINRAPKATDVRPAGQEWYNTVTGAKYFSRGAGTWVQYGTTTGVAAHQATHRAGGSDPLPWTTINGKGTTAARPAAAASNAGYRYEDTTTGRIYRSTGSAWEEEASSKAAGAYTHTQATASATWTITHNLGRHPAAISIEDSAGMVCQAEIQHTSLNITVLRFGYPFSGTATLK